MSESDMKADMKKLYDKAPYALLIGIATILLLKGPLALIVHVVILVPIALVVTVWRGKPIGPSTCYLAAWLLFASGLWEFLMRFIVGPLIIGGM